MAKNPVPSLSLAGYIQTPAEKADLLLAHWCASNKSQSALYGKNVSNAQWLIEKYGKNIQPMVQAMNQELLDYFSRYFEQVDVDIAADSSSDPAKMKVVLRIFISFVDDGKQYTVGNLLHAINGIFNKIIKIANDGTTS